MSNNHCRWVALTLTVAVLSATSLGVSAETLHYWRFEGANFLSDSVGSADLGPTSATQTTHGDMGPGSMFPTQSGASGATKSALAKLNHSGYPLCN